MKRFFCVLVLAILLLNAEEFQDGLSGNASIGVGIKNIKSNISTLADDDYLHSYSGGNSGTDFIPFLGLEFYYGGIGGDDRAFLKNYNGKKISGLALGYEKTYDMYYTTSFSFVTSLRERAYVNPYAIGNREKTGVKRLGFELKQNYEFMPEYNVFLSYLFHRNNFDKEMLPYSNLRRDGYFHEFKLGFKHSMFNANLDFGYNDADGKAEQFTQYGLSLGANLPISQDLILIPNVGISKYKAFGTNHIFGRKQSGKTYKLGMRVIRNNLFEVDKLYGFAAYGFEKKNSDISFFDETFHVFLTGVGYRF